MINLVACPACGQGIPDQASSCPNCGAPFVLRRYKDKTAATILAFFGGFLGLHRFYLGQWWGVLYLLCAWTGLSIVISLAEGIVFLVRSREAWDAKYNTGQSGNMNGSIAWIIIGIALTVICSVVFVITLPILAAIALPVYQDHAARQLTLPAYEAASQAAQKVAEYYQRNGSIPASLQAAGYSIQPPAGVERITVDQDNGTLIIAFDKKPLQGQTMTLVPSADIQGIITWVCSSPGIRRMQLPQSCRQ